MKKKMIIIGLMITALCLAAGCQSKTEEAPPLEAEIIEDEVSMETQKQKNSTENNSDSQSVKEEISGMVKGVGDNSVAVSQIFTMDTEDGQIAVSPASEDGNENILSIYFNAGAEYEFNIIRDGGGNVESREGSFEDIKKGMILHMTGNWDGNDFYADIISINEVR